ncbi:hypothetical protein D3C72_2509850 [compost metagenome]
MFSDVECTDLYRRLHLGWQLVEVVSLGHAYIYSKIMRHLNQRPGRSGFAGVAAEALPRLLERLRPGILATF